MLLVGKCRSKQLREHYEIIIKHLQARLDSLSKGFYRSVEKRTKALSTKHAEQASRYGAPKVQLPSHVTPKPVGYTPGASISSTNSYSNTVASDFCGINSGKTSLEADGSLRRRGAYVSRDNLYMESPRDGPSDGHKRSVKHIPNTYPNYESSKKDDDFQVHSTPFSARQVAMYDHQSLERQRAAIDMENVQKTITEVGQMYMQVASLVAEQEHITNQIGIDIDDSLVNVQSGREQLLIYYNNLTRERQLILKLLLATALLGAFFIYFWS